MLSHYHRTRLLLLAGISACVAVFYFASRAFSIPSCPGFGGSIINEPSPAVSLLVITLALVACVMVGTLIAGTIRFDAGLFCAVIGMSVLTFRGGTAGQVLREAAPTGSVAVFIWLALETILLFGIVGLAWGVLWLLHDRGLLKPDQIRDGVEAVEHPLGLKIAAMGMQAGGMALVMLLLMQTDTKMQAVLGVGIAAWAGAVAAYYVYPVSPSPWLWAGIPAVGVVGYVMTYFNPQGYTIGQPGFALAGLARALPIDYATAGPAGAIIGYWMARKWFAPEDEGEVAEAA